MAKALLFGGTDGHGVAMTVASEKALLAKGYEATTVCKYVVTKYGQPLPEDCGTGQPVLFWGVTFQNWDFLELGSGDAVVVVDIPLPVPDKRIPDAPERGLAKIKELIDRGVRVVLVDHHKVSETYYGQARKLGAEVIVSSAAETTHYGAHDVFASKWGRIGAICDRDTAVLPVTEEEEDLALALDSAVRRDLAGALEAIRRDDESWFEVFKGAVPEPEVPAEVRGNVVWISTLHPTWGFKQLDQACREAGADYGVGLNLSRGAAIVAITYWKGEALPVALKLGLTKFRGHGEAVVIPVYSTGKPAEPEEAAEAEAKAVEMIERLNADLEPSGNDGNGNGPGSIFGYVSSFLRKVEIPFFLTEHGWGHVQRVIGHGRTLGSLFGLSEAQQRLLDWSAALHDVGNGAATVYPEEGLTDKDARKRHHEFSVRMIHEWAESGLFEGIVAPEEVDAVGQLCFAHRKAVELPADPAQRLLTVLLRVADGIDIDARRAQKNDQGIFFEEIWDLPEDSRPHWEGHRAIKALRLDAEPDGGLVFEFVVTDRQAAAFQVAELTKELAPLAEFADWSVKVTEIG